MRWLDGAAEAASQAVASQAAATTNSMAADPSTSSTPRATGA